MACIFTTPPEVLSGRHAAKIKKKFKNAQIIFKKWENSPIELFRAISATSIIFLC